MSAQGIESVLSHAMSDPAFADQLFSNAQQALAGYDLTPDEAATFRNLSRTDFEKMTTASPEERKSFSLNFGLTGNHNETGLTVH